MLPTKRQTSWIPTILNDFMGSDWLTKMGQAAPSINIIENDKRFRIEICAPGMGKEDLTIELKNENHLEVTMGKKCKCKPSDESKDSESTEQEQKEPQEGGEECCDWAKERKKDIVEGRFLRKDFSYMHFSQTLILPDNVDKARITAKQENGVLTLLLPKKQAYIDAQATKVITVD